MELLNFINNNSYNFDSLKQVLESELFNLKIKEDADYPDIFLIHTQENSNFNSVIVRECNGIILEKNTFKIVCYSFNKCLEDDSLDPSLDINNLYIENANEGTLVRLFYYKNTWLVSTKKCINAAKSKWLSNKNFLELFQDCIQGLNFESNLKTDNCYSFMLYHPENRMVVNYLAPTLEHISTRDLISMKEIDEYIGICKQTRQKIDIVNFNDLKSMNILDKEGFILIDTSFNRQKVKTNIYKHMRTLWGNTNNRFYRYLELRKDQFLLTEYFTYFNHEKLQCIRYETKIADLANKILVAYIDRHISKNSFKVPYYFHKIIYKLHGDFMKDKVKTDYNKIMLTLLEMEPRKVCFIINSLDKDIKKRASNELGAEGNQEINYDYLMEE